MLRMNIVRFNPAPAGVRNFNALAILLLTLTAFPALCADDSSPYAAHNWQVQDGLPHNSIQAIAQTRDGYLWLGTLRGLARFGGDHFTVFDEKNVPILRN